MKRIALLVTILCFILWPLTALCTQVHSQPEGLYGHQLAHLFFIVSMIILVYWLRVMKLIRYKGWRYINYSALFFVLWNIDAMLVHFLDGTNGIFIVTHKGWEGTITISAQNKVEAVLYYMAKLDHVFCVPAIIFLYLGLRALTQQMGNDTALRGIQK